MEIDSTCLNCVGGLASYSVDMTLGVISGKPQKCPKLPLTYCNFLGDSKSCRASKLHNWLKSYNHFAKWVDFVYWWSFNGGGSAINRATLSSFYSKYQRKSKWLDCLQLF